MRPEGRNAERLEGGAGRTWGEAGSWRVGEERLEGGAGRTWGKAGRRRGQSGVAAPRSHASGERWEDRREERARGLCKSRGAERPTRAPGMERFSVLEPEPGGPEGAGLTRGTLARGGVRLGLATPSIRDTVRAGESRGGERRVATHTRLIWHGT
eukprot:1187244-Prorocentrum_minimum.AAC.6